MNRLLKTLFFLVLVKPLLLLIGVHIRHRERLPDSGPAILVANHNSHLDTLVLMSLFPLSRLHQVRPVADEQYFLHQNPWLAWFSRYVLDIIPVAREPKPEDGQGDRSPEQTLCGHRAFLKHCDAALQQNQILILYPEGSRGEPERLTQFNSGVAHLSKQHPQVPIVPIFLHGLGKALPKGECLLVPFLCHVFIGEALYWTGNKQTFLSLLTATIQALSAEETFPAWK
jgi:1-acyl-sn-glycerol-3-phosphate acyltransferase